MLPNTKNYVYTRFSIKINRAFKYSYLESFIVSLWAKMAKCPFHPKVLVKCPCSKKYLGKCPNFETQFSNFSEKLDLAKIELLEKKLHGTQVPCSFLILFLSSIAYNSIF